MSDRTIHIAAVFGTALIQALIVSLVVVAPQCSGSEAGAAIENRFENAQVIEAALAFKKKTKKKQPQKKKKVTVKPTDQKISRDEKTVVENKDEKKEKPRPSEIDIKSVLEKNRQLQDEDLSDTGSDEVEPDEGSPFGSEWGTERQAKGDPYLGELKGRIQKTMEGVLPPTAKTGSQAWGCVRLDEDGAIVDRQQPPEGKSKTDEDLNLAIEIALNRAPNMEKPIPKEPKWLKKFLTENGVCFRFKVTQRN